MAKKRKPPPPSFPTGAKGLVDEARLLADLRDLIRAGRQRVATFANSTHTLLCWHVGRRLLRENLTEGRAAYGKGILATVSQELTAEFGDGFSYSALTRMPVRRNDRRRGDCCDAVARIELVPLQAILPSRTRSPATSTPRCAASSAGMSGHSGRRSAACCSSARPCPGTPRRSSPRRSPTSATVG